MKQKISVTIEEETIKLIETILADARFRNRSHVIEYSLKEFLKSQEENLNTKEEGK
jgi:Arc/MetJ-type ribon-helix-helix transcriptional regulator